MIIARSWHGRVPRQHTDRFGEHMRTTGIAEAAAVPGYLGAASLLGRSGLVATPGAE